MLEIERKGRSILKARREERLIPYWSIKVIHPTTTITKSIIFQ
jgi:hypothetical protein